MKPVTRFAPSPTGHLHLGHAYSALFAKRAAEDGVFLLRIEDIDPTRCKSEFTEGIFEDLHWLGLKWPEPVRRQSLHIKDYTNALDILRNRGLVYPCFCTRRDVEREAQKSVQAPHLDDGLILYAGTCRHLTEGERAKKLLIHDRVNWRLDVAGAIKTTGSLFWHDRARGRITAAPELFGDVVLARKDASTSYHLSVTVDDHLQGVTLVTRGEDLLPSTHIHRLLQALFKYEVPDYHHHELLSDATGKRFAKRDKSVTLRALRAQGATVTDVIKQLVLR